MGRYRGLNRNLPLNSDNMSNNTCGSLCSLTGRSWPNWEQIADVPSRCATFTLHPYVPSTGHSLKLYSPGIPEDIIYTQIELRIFVWNEPT